MGVWDGPVMDGWHAVGWDGIMKSFVVFVRV